MAGAPIITKKSKIGNNKAEDFSQNESGSYEE